MRVVVQRVTRASVTVENKIVGSIGPGLLVLLGIGRNDSKKDCEFICRKILNMRLWHSEGKTWDKSVVAKNYEILVVSQFTLHGFLKGSPSVLRFEATTVTIGNKPDFHLSMNPTDSKKMYFEFLELLKSQYKKELIQEGEFGAMMSVELCNDG
jgi:D-tyrosyl-tRNA(Tyr) deacylase